MEEPNPFITTKRFPVDIYKKKTLIPSDHPHEIDYPNQLKFFVGPKSWLLFILLNVDAEMLA